MTVKFESSAILILRSSEKIITCTVGKESYQGQYILSIKIRIKIETLKFWTWI